MTGVLSSLKEAQEIKKMSNNIVDALVAEDEQIAAEYIKKEVTKPVVGFIAGRTAPPGKRMGHAGAIISSGDSTAEAKREVLKAAGVTVVDFPDEIPSVFTSKLAA